MLNALPPILAANPLEHVVNHPLVKTDAGVWLLTTHMVMIFLVAIIMLLIFPKITKRYQNGEHVPTGTRNFFEAILLYMRDDVAKPLLGAATTKYMPYLWTLFFFILFANLLGMLPIDILTSWILPHSVNHGHGIAGTATGNIWVTGTLAVITFIVTQISGLRANGLKGWLHHFLGGAPWYVAPVMIPVEFMGMLVKPFALAVRLFANMTAGHILLAVIISFVPAAFIATGATGGVPIGIVSVVSSVLVMVLELLVACIQAYLFVFLTALFISQMITHDHEDHEDEFHNGHPVVEEVADHRPAHRAHQM
jgi:F-type H+-transporting ATPase subunit a